MTYCCTNPGKEMLKLELLLPVWFLLSGIVSDSPTSQQAPEHTLKTCTQRKGYEVKCEDFVQEEVDDNKSLWPAGPYVIPMTRHGCPESSMYGWQEGYIDIKWKISQYGHTRAKSSGSTYEKVINVTKEHFFETPDRHMIVSASPDEFKFSFCYKVKRNTTLDIGAWPDWNFTIYGADNGCPEEFVQSTSEIVLPNISRWDSYGYLPDFVITNNGTNNLLQIQLCSRRIENKTHANATIDDVTDIQMDEDVHFINISNREIYSTSFFLIKNDQTPCPVYQNAIASEETLFFLQSSNSNADSDKFETFPLCYYELNKYSNELETWLLEKSLKNAYSVYLSSITEGIYKVAASFFGFTYYKYYYWKVVDLGKTVIVSAVDITSPTGEPDVCGNIKEACFISREKMDFLYTDAFVCKYVKVCRIATASMSLLFTRTLEGRFVAVSVNKEIPGQIINVYTERVINDVSATCNSELGMSDNGITDDQISASSALIAYTPDKARPYHHGWCSDFQDDQPFVEIVFKEVLALEGITIYNTKETELSLSAELMNYFSFGQKTFLLHARDNNGSNIFNKTLNIDTSRVDSYPQNFWFQRRVSAKSITIIVQKTVISTITCLRFELLGCKSSSALIQPYKVPGHAMNKEVAFISEIYEDRTILTNIGFPNHYQLNQIYQWIITYPTNHYIKLVFTHIELTTLKVPSFCIDTLKISNRLFDSDFGRVIDHTFNGVNDSLVVETEETQLVLSFETCPNMNAVSLGSGFKAFASYENIPTCFSLHPYIPWHEGLRETCRQTLMMITSMAYLGFPFVNTTEQWTIHVPMRRLKLQIISFYVPCKTTNYKSEFKITNMEEENVYCNIHKPPDIIESSFDNITVHFYRGVDPWPRVPNVEGFRIVYSVINEEEKMEMIDSKHTMSAVKNVAVNKRVYFQSPHGLSETYFPTDGLTHPDASACLDTRQYFILLDLYFVYNVSYVVLYHGIGELIWNATIAFGSYDIVISTGLTIWETNQVARICGEKTPSRTVQLHTHAARYILLEQMLDTSLVVCEIKVFANKGQQYDSRKDIYLLNAVHGEWGHWSSWSTECHCDGHQYRHRLCNNPVERFYGRKCPGESISKQPCSSISADCEAYEESAYLDICTNNNIVTDSVGLQHWSEWGTCSSDCGNGLMSRQRKCTTHEATNIDNNCKADIVETRPCIGNKPCLVCARKFKKCYSILSKVTNWNQAQLECWTRNMSLVTIMSLSEMRFIKYLLRERRNIDVPPFNYFDAEYYVHIGLNVGSSENDKAIWGNGIFAAYFTAWNSKKSSTTGSCTRMNFKLFNDDKTWEREDCDLKLAEYIMCEKTQDGQDSVPIKSLTTYVETELVDVPEQSLPSEYEGNVSVTINGVSCRNSSCRFNVEIQALGCKQSDGLWRECSVKLPTKEDSSVVYKKYLGTLSTTFSGKMCQRWDRLYPHTHSLHGPLFKGEGISDAANFCRDPGDMGHLWCFTSSSDTRWEPCSLNEIKAERHCVNGEKYTGQRNTTVTGKKCQTWARIKDNNNGFTDNDIDTSSNLCRDPSNYGFSWCFVDTSLESDKWEPCQIEEPHSSTGMEENILETKDDVFLCDDGKIFPQMFRCNGKLDCEDKADEMGCLYLVHPLLIADVEEKNDSMFRNVSLENGSFFRCKSNDLISVVARCDEVIDCFDASDELNCRGEKESRTCSDYQFQCDDGDCIHISQVCNFKDDCIDGSDEYCEFEQCSTLSEYRCDSGPCIPLEQRCDAIQQCKDGSDERVCDECQPGVAFHCDFGRCIPLRLTCDEYQHCEDGTDEINCDNKVFDSCQDVWEAGYRKSGFYYILDNKKKVKCLFDEIELEIIRTLFDFDFNVVSTDVGGLFPIEIQLTTIYDDPETQKEKQLNSVIYNSDRTSCIQQITKSCPPPIESVVRLNESYRFCPCSIFNYEITQTVDRAPLRNAEQCKSVANQSWTIYQESPVSNGTWASIALSMLENGRGFTTFYQRNYMQLIISSAVCEHDYKAIDDDFVCDINGKHIPNIMRCIYDMDENGFTLGCRDGSHLKDCEKYECPQDMIKCPNSYCLPQQFLCDGHLHCPGGEDEDSCGCTPSTNEILIIHDEETSDGPDIKQFAQQFSTPTNIVRVLSYKASKPLQAYNIDNILLDVLDKEINRVNDNEKSFQCRYKIMANRLLGSIRFTNDGTKGIILIHSTGAAENAINEIVDSKTGLQTNVKIYKVKENFNLSSSAQFSSHEAKVLDINVRRWKNLNAIGANYFSELCNITTKVYCPNGYKCASTRTCITLDQVCDGFAQCLHGDDEDLCNFQCPFNCSCTGYVANCRNSYFNVSLLSSVSTNTRLLDLSFNDGLSTILEDSNLNIMSLSVLNLSYCSIKRVVIFSFGQIRNLRSLDISFNLITVLSNFVFYNLKQLKFLNIRGNSYLSVIEMHAFAGLGNVQELNLANAQLETISADTFSGMTLKSVDLSNNKLSELEGFAFRDSSIKYINFKDNDVKTFNKDIFTGLIGLENLVTPEFKFCCIRPNYVKEENCFPQKDEFSSCDDLMRHSVLQFLIWLIGIMAFVGNILTILYRLKYDTKRLKLGFGIFVTNLAVADFLMSAYLITIAIADSAFRKRYIFMDDYWRHSVWCNLAGILSTISSEASVLFLCLITLDRLLVIKFPFGRAKLSKDRAVACATFTWIFSVTAAIFPVAYEGYFKNEFYSKSGVCIALPLTRDRPPGWVYSLSVFVGLNFLMFVLVAVGQLSIFIEIRKASGIAKSVQTARTRDLKVARNLLLVVATDFMCWFPIGLMAIMALSGYVISGEVYAWAAVFILPVNSALNPILYTLSAVVGGQSFTPSMDEQSFKKMTEEIGRSTLRCFTASRYFTTRLNRKKYLKISDISGEIQIPTISILSIAMKLAHTLEALHSCTLGIKLLNKTDIYVGVRGNQLTGSVKIKGEPFISYKQEEKMESINELGVIIRNMISARERNKKQLLK